MRAFAARLGSPLKTRYAYYEEKRFSGPLPVHAARRIAAELQPFGVDPSDVLALADVAPDQQDMLAQTTPSSVQLIRLDVALPSEDALTRMFETMLEGHLPPSDRDGLAQNLARRLPAALQRASASPPVPVRDPAPPGREGAEPRASNHRLRRRGSHI